MSTGIGQTASSEKAQESQEKDDVPESVKELLESTPTGVTPDSERRCNDWAWGIAFLCLTGFVTGYGISGIRMLRHVGFCERVIPGNAPVSDGPLELYQGCLTHLVRGEASASGICTSWGIGKALSLTASAGSSLSLSAIPDTAHLGQEAWLMSAPSAMHLQSMPTFQTDPAARSSRARLRASYGGSFESRLASHLVRPLLPPQHNGATRRVMAQANAATAAECLSLFIATQAPSPACLGFGLSLGMAGTDAAASLAAASLLLDSCVTPLMVLLGRTDQTSPTDAGSVLEKCAVYSGASLPGAPSVPQVQSLLNNCALGEGRASCFNTALKSAGVTDTGALALVSDACFAQALTGRAFTADAAGALVLRCLDAVLPHRIKAGVSIPSFLDGCLVPLLRNQSGTLLRCAFQTGQILKLGGFPSADDMECLAYAMSASPSEKCLQYGAKLALGDSNGAIAGGLASNCLLPFSHVARSANNASQLQQLLTDALTSCADYAIAIAKPNLAGLVPDCVAQNLNNGQSALQICLQTHMQQLLPVEVRSAVLDNCLVQLAPLLTTGAPTELGPYTEAALYCLNFGLPTLPSRFVPVQSVLDSCIAPLLKGLPALLPCAAALGIDAASFLPIPKEVVSCLSYAADRTGPPPADCIKFALDLLFPGTFASSFFTSCVAPLSQNPPNITGAVKACTPFTLDQVHLGAGQVYKDCVAAGQAAVVGCVRDELARRGVDTSLTVPLLDNCVGPATAPTADPKSALYSCAYVAVDQVWEGGRGDSIAALWSACVRPLLERETNAVATCASSFGGVPVPLPGGLQEAVDQCLMPLILNSPRKWALCVNYALSKVLKQPDTTLATEAWDGCIGPYFESKDSQTQAKCTAYAISRSDPQVGQRVSDCLAGQSAEACIRTDLEQATDPVLRALLKDCVIPAAQGQTGATLTCLRLGLTEAAKQGLANANVTAEIQKAVQIVSSFLQHCILPVVDKSRGAAEGCLRIGLITALDSKLVFSLIARGIGKVVPPDTGLSGPCLEELLIDPNSPPNCLVESLVKLGANFLVGVAKEKAREAVGLSVESDLEQIDLLDAGSGGASDLFFQAELATTGSESMRHVAQLLEYSPSGGRRGGRFELGEEDRAGVEEPWRVRRESKEGGQKMEKKVAEQEQRGLGRALAGVGAVLDLFGSGLFSPSGGVQYRDDAAAGISQKLPHSRHRHSSSAQSDWRAPADGESEEENLNSQDGTTRAMELQWVGVFGNIQWKGLGRMLCEDIVETRAYIVTDWYDAMADEVWLYRFDLVAIFLWCLLFGVILAIMWMVVVKRYAERLIKYAICMGLLNYLIMSGVNLAYGNIPGATIILVFFVLKILWYCWIRGRLAFAAAVLRVSLSAIRKSPGPFLLSVFMFVLQCAWCMIFAGAAFRFYAVGDTNVGDIALKRFGEVLLILSFFWVTEVIKNVLAVTIAGSIAMWYYYDGTKKMPFSPTLIALRRALTFSIGSICFGSVIVALLATAQYFMKKAKKTDKPWLRAILLCLIACVKKVVELFNMYAFVQVATHGKSYCRAAKDTFRLMRHVGLEALVNDDIVDGVLATGRWLGALALMGTAGVLTVHTYNLPWEITAWAMLLAFSFGYVIMKLATVVVEMAAAALFVLFAIDPYCLQHAHPALYEELRTNWLKAHKDMPKGLHGASTRGPDASPDVSENRRLNLFPRSSSPDLPADAAVELVTPGPDKLALSPAQAKEFKSMTEARPLPQLRKYPRSGKLIAGLSHMREIELDRRAQTIRWRAPTGASAKAEGRAVAPAKEKEGEEKEDGESENQVKLAEVRTVTLGAQTSSLQKRVKPEQHDCCFSIHTDTREVNFQADTPEQARLWVAGLQQAIAETAQGGAISSTGCVVS
eukprot:g51308.t1